MCFVGCVRVVVRCALQVNLVELERSEESLRGTVFYEVFKDTLLMDTDRAAHKYWNSLVNLPDHLACQVTTMPTIYTLEGSRWVLFA